MINYISVANEAGELLTLDLRNPYESGFAVENITGLTQGSTTINLTDYASLPGSVFNTARKGTRNIVINLVLLWANTVEQARHKCNLYFPINEKVRLTFYTEERTCYIDGYVETNDPTIFSTSNDKPGIPCSVSILCPDPAFKSINVESNKYYNLLSGFHFDFPYKYTWKNHTNYPADPVKVHMGIIGETPIIFIESESDMKHGLKFQISFHSSARKISISSERDGATLVISPSGNFQAGDLLQIDTTRGKKSIRVLRDGSYYNFLQYKTATSDWVQVLPGNNRFSYSIDDGENNSAVSIYTEYQDEYWSV